MNDEPGAPGAGMPPIPAGQAPRRGASQVAGAGGDGGSGADREARGDRDLTIVDPDGRRKVYRPLPGRQRLAALDAGLAAYRRGEFFEAHELMEPAWMGSADLVERDLYQGLIKVAAAGVHATRGNPAGVRKNLAGAARRLARVVANDPPPREGTLTGALARVDVRALLAWAERVGTSDDPLPDAARPAPPMTR